MEIVMEWWSTPWWWIPLVLLLAPLVAAVAKAISELHPIIQWYTSRAKAQLAFVNEQLAKDDLSPDMRTHLLCERDRLLLQVTRTIAVKAQVAKAMLAASEDHPGGIDWDELRRAADYCDCDDQGTLVIRIHWLAWLGAMFPLLGALYYFLVQFQERLAEMWYCIPYAQTALCPITDR